jgi:queuine tRNA-ribosyltransferase
MFKSHIDGSPHMFSPEKVMDIQRSIGGDIIMAFDECPAFGAGYEYAEKSMHMTHRWLDRCINRFNETPDPYGFAQNLFPIVQGGTFEGLRRQSCIYIAGKNAPGNAIGGLSVGEPEEILYSMTALCCTYLPAEKPRYLMGVGTPYDLVCAIEQGIDMFDCVLPTRNARNGQALTRRGKIVIKQARYKDDSSPLDPTCNCACCTRGYSRAYLRHLFLAGEILVLRLFSLHNLHFYGQIVAEARAAIQSSNFAEYKRRTLQDLSSGETARTLD